MEVTTINSGYGMALSFISERVCCSVRWRLSSQGVRGEQGESVIAVVGATSLIVALFVVPKHFLVRCPVRWCRVMLYFVQVISCAYR